MKIKPEDRDAFQRWLYISSDESQRVERMVAKARKLLKRAKADVIEAERIVGLAALEISDGWKRNKRA